MPAYAKNGKVVCFFRSGQVDKERYSTLGFSDQANLDDGAIWPTVYALTGLGEADEATISALVKEGHELRRSRSSSTPATAAHDARQPRTVKSSTLDAATVVVVIDCPEVRLERRVLPAAHRFPRHAHASWSLSVVLSGVGYFRSAGTLHRAGAGAVTVLHPGESHDGWAHVDDGLDYLVVSMVESAAAVLHGSVGIPRFPERVVTDREFVSAVRSAHAAPGSAAVLAIALARLYRRHARGRRVDGNLSLVTAMARRHIDEHYREPVRLAQLAALAEVSPATLARRFRAETGLAPYEYLVSRRIDAAMDLLGAGRSVTETAALTGFADQSHLHRHFRRVVGVTPGRFRTAR